MKFTGINLKLVLKKITNEETQKRSFERNKFFYLINIFENEILVHRF